MKIFSVDAETDGLARRVGQAIAATALVWEHLCGKITKKGEKKEKLPMSTDQATFAQFAGHALTGLLARGQISSPEDYLAARAFALADAMAAEMNRRYPKKGN